ncbi:MAG: SDR family NAD(P)-dependent oxidoreductase [Evtepia gabavorous]
MNIALITGASSGLGREFARQVSRDPHVQAVWAVARREDRLRQLASLCACPVRPVPLDLTDPQSLDALRDLLAREKPTVTRLVCAAGVGKMGRIDAVSPADSLGMIDLNCRAAVGVTQLCLPYLTRGSRVLELCSTAAFQPMPGLGVYAATKAFLQSYTKTLHYELSPGDSRHRCLPLLGEGHRVHPLAQDGKPGQFRHFPLASRSRSVVSLSLAASALNLWVATPGIVCTLHRLGAKVIPHALLVPLMMGCGGL